MGFLDRLRKHEKPAATAPSLPPPDPLSAQRVYLPPPVATSAVEAATLPDGGWLQAVGESFYRDAFLALFGRPPEYGFAIPAIAELVPEPDNTHDPAAVAVRISGRKVGHLSRDDARYYRRVVDEAIAVHGRATANAEVRSYGLDPMNPATEFSVLLRLSDRPTSAPEPRPDEVRLATGGTVSVSNEEHYQAALTAATNRRDLSSYGYPVVAALAVADEGNPWIKKPTGPLLSVRVGAETVGYLTRAMTERYQPFAEQASLERKNLTAEAWLQKGVRGGEKFIEISLNAVPRRADRNTIEGLTVEVSPELVITRRTGTVHRLAGQRPDGTWETACGMQVMATPDDLIGTTKPWVGRVEVASGRIYDDRLPFCERC